MSNENFSPEVPPQGYVPTPPPAPGYGQSAPPPQVTPSYGQVPPQGFPPAAPVAPYGFAPGAQPAYASFGKRALGAVVDWIPFLLLTGITGGLTYTSGSTSFHINGVFGTLLSLVGFAYAAYNMWYLGGTTGVTFGRRIAGTKLISEQTLQPIGIGMAVVRHIAHFIDTLICGFGGFLFPLFTARKQTIADMLVKTIVVEENR